MVIQVLLGVLAWALIAGPLLLLWWLPGGGEAAGEQENRLP